MTGTPHRVGFHGELPHGYGFDEHGTLEPVWFPADLEEPDEDAPDCAPTNESAIRREVVVRFLGWLLRDARGPAHVGRRAMLMAALMRHQDAPAVTVRSLGKLLAVSIEPRRFDRQLEKDRRQAVGMGPRNAVEQLLTRLSLCRAPGTRLRPRSPGPSESLGTSSHKTELTAPEEHVALTSDQDRRFPLDIMLHV